MPVAKTDNRSSRYMPQITWGEWSMLTVMRRPIKNTNIVAGGNVFRNSGIETVDGCSIVEKIWVAFVRDLPRRILRPLGVAPAATVQGFASHDGIIQGSGRARFS
jgi:hypothetical protein